MGVGAGLYMYDVVVKSSRSLSHLLVSSCCYDGYRKGQLCCIKWGSKSAYGKTDFPYAMSAIPAVAKLL